MRKGCLPEKDKGSIKLSQKVRITDPCYDMNTWCAGSAEIKPGIYLCREYTYNSKFTYNGKTTDDVRCMALEIVHKDCTGPSYTKHLPIDVGVDSGQAGFFDEPYFRKISTKEEFCKKWYNRVCRLTYKRPLFIYGDSPDMIFNLLQHYSKRNQIDTSLVTMKYAKKLYKDIQTKGEKWIGGGFQSGTIDNKGFVSSSGYGDGGYDCFVSENAQGETDALLLVFIFPDLPDRNMPAVFKEPVKWAKRNGYYS